MALEESVDVCDRGLDDSIYGFLCIESAVRRDDYIRHSKQHMIRHEIAQVVLIADWALVRIARPLRRPCGLRR